MVSAECRAFIYRMLFVKPDIILILTLSFGSPHCCLSVSEAVVSRFLASCLLIIAVSATEVMHLSQSVGLFVCLSVNRINQKVVDESM